MFDFNKNMYMTNREVPVSYTNSDFQNERVGFLGPFLLGGITGGLVAPFFYGGGYGGGYGYNQPYYTNNYYYPPYSYYNYRPY